MNHSGYELCQETGTFNSVELGAGTYSINSRMQGSAMVTKFTAMQTTARAGIARMSQSQAFQSINGTIPSESFTIFGTVGGGSTPEPGSLLLFGSGVAGVVAWLRRSKAISN